MQKLVESQNISNLVESFKKLITNQDVYDFLEKNEIPLEEAVKYFSEFELYEMYPEKYELTYNLRQVNISEAKDKANPGIYYLDEPYFLVNKTMDMIDIDSNPSKVNVVKYCLENLNKGAYLFSPNGVGKTTLAVALGNEKYDRTNIKSLFVFWPDFIEKTKRFKDNNVFFIDKVRTAPSLIIDDLGQESITTWSRDDILHPIITFRLEKNLPTYITSNYLLEELQDIYTFRTAESKKSRSIIEKITTLAKPFELQGENLRKE